MSFGNGRDASPVILEVSELTEADAELRPIKAPILKKLHDSHHMLARLFALGYKNAEVARRSGYSIEWVGQLYNTDIFKTLIAHYRGMVDEQFVESVDEYFSLAEAARNKSMRLINDKLDSIEDPDDISIRELVTIHQDTADRTGYPKRSVAVNLNVDFAARLDRAISASNKAKVIEHSPSPTVAESSHPRADVVREGGVSGEAPPSSLKSRVA